MNESALLRTYREAERDLLRFLIRRLKCVFTAKDLAHDVYLKLHEVPETAQVRNGRAYLFRMAANLATDHLRTESRRGQLLSEAHELLWSEAETRTPERDAIARDELEQMRKAISALPDMTRKIFHLNRFGGKTQKEIAAELGVSQTTVEKHIRKVLDHLAAARGDGH
jgi:RNA polymerase sigma factor (sigma-70 family)